MLKSYDKEIIEFIAGDRAFSPGRNDIFLDYITNKDDSIRWLFPVNLAQPTFLNFYSTSSLRAKIFSQIFKIAFSLNFKSLVVSGKLGIKIDSYSILDKILQANKFDNFSIFLGTMGDNRKVLLELHYKGVTVLFVKIGLTESSKKLVENEKEILTELEVLKFSIINFPKLLKCENEFIELSNIKPKNYSQPSQIREIHIKALAELYSKFPKTNNWKDLQIFNEVTEDFQQFMSKVTIAKEIQQMTVYLRKNIEDSLNSFSKDFNKVSLSMSHGDFTPWNMYVTTNKIHLLDWELSRREMPLLFDLFHFIFQSEIMLNKGNLNSIKTRLKAVFNLRQFKGLIKSYEIQVNLNYRFYLTYISAYYLNKYVNQNELHHQAKSMIKIWDEAFSDYINNNEKVF